jgi:alpha-amylase
MLIRKHVLICICSYFPLTRAFSSTKGNISELIEMQSKVQNSCKDTTLLLTFASNHDQPRLAAFSPSLVLRKNALAYTILSDGIPTLYQGDEQAFSGAGDPDNREAMWLSGFDRNTAVYVMVRKLNMLGAWVGQRDSRYWTSTTSIFWSDTHTMAMGKGSEGNKVVAILTNRGEGMVAETARVNNSGFAAGTTLLDVVACKRAVVGHDGVLSVELSGGNPHVFFPLSQLSGSVICKSWDSKHETVRLSSISRQFSRFFLWFQGYSS